MSDLEPKPTKKTSNGKSLRVVDDQGPPLFDDGPACPEWELKLKRFKGRVTKSIANVQLILTEHEAWRGKIVHDSFASRTLAQLPPPCTEAGHWRDVDTTRTRVWLADTYGIEASSDMVDAVIESIAHNAKRHPVCEYLDGLKWDGVQRLPLFLTQYFGCPGTRYYEEIGKMWMISGVARVRQPGCQADYVLVLVSPEQGLRKSTAIGVLSKGWGADTVIPIGDKDALQALRGVWIYELSELSSIRSARDVETVKGFITSRVDHYRAPFERRTKDWPRQCIFAGSSNDDQFLNDPTGNRRFWPADCGQIDITGLREVVDQLWAEADARYQSGEPWYPTDAEVRRELRDEQIAHTQLDPWLQRVVEWLEDPHRTIRRGPDDYQRIDYERSGVTTTEVLMGAIRMQAEKCDRWAETRVGKILRDLGLQKRQIRIQLKGTGSRMWRYFKNDQMSLESQPVTTTTNPPVVTHEPAQMSLLSQQEQPNSTHNIHMREGVTGDAIELGAQREIGRDSCDSSDKTVGQEDTGAGQPEEPDGFDPDSFG